MNETIVNIRLHTRTVTGAIPTPVNVIMTQSIMFVTMRDNINGAKNMKKDCLRTMDMLSKTSSNRALSINSGASKIHLKWMMFNNFSMIAPSTNKNMLSTRFTINCTFTDHGVFVTSSVLLYEISSSNVFVQATR